MDVDAAARAPFSSNAFQNIAQASKNINRMIAEGRKYRFLEHMGGRGILLVLGKHIPKT